MTHTLMQDPGHGVLLPYQTALMKASGDTLVSHLDFSLLGLQLLTLGGAQHSDTSVKFQITMLDDLFNRSVVRVRGLLREGLFGETRVTPTNSASIFKWLWCARLWEYRSK